MKIYVTSSTSTPLKTYKGSSIKRSKYGVGKSIGGDLYFHRNYAKDIIPIDLLDNAEEVLRTEFPYFVFNCIKYTPKTGAISFQEAPDFNTAREPIVGDYVTVYRDGSVRSGHSNYIWHHKWLWVKDDYTGFDVQESYEWSKRWLSVLKEKSDGNGRARWNSQLSSYGLPIESNTDIEEILHTSVDPEYGSCYLIDSGLFVFNDAKGNTTPTSFHGDYMKYFPDDEEVYNKLENSILLNSRKPECSIRVITSNISSNQWNSLEDWIWFIYDSGNEFVEVCTLGKPRPKKFMIHDEVDDLFDEIKNYISKNMR